MVEKNVPKYSGMPWIRKRIKATNAVLHKLTYDDVHTIDGKHPIERIASLYYGDSKYWFVIADVNPLRDPKEWSVGETVIVPSEWPVVLIREAE
ncbi:MAG: hypothetical protein V1799_07440 [bacterium]